MTIDLDELDPSDHRPLVLSADEVRALRRLARIGAAVEAELPALRELAAGGTCHDNWKRDSIARILEAGK